MNTSHGVREAKEFLVSRIVLEAEQEGVPLSEVERKMLYFSETDWTLPDMGEVSEEFDRKYDQDEYETRIVQLVRRAYSHICRVGGDQYNRWRSSVDLLSKGDHYILVMIGQGDLRPRGDQLKLFGAGMLAVTLLFALGGLSWFLSHKFGIDFRRHFPSEDAFAFFIWTGAICFAIAYPLFEFFVGRKKSNPIFSRCLRKLAGLGRREE